jgi:hypothetical protein
MTKDNMPTGEGRMDQRETMAGEGLTLKSETMSSPKRGLGRRTKLVLLLMALIVAFPIGYYLISPLFVNVTVSEVLSTDGLKILAQGTFVGADTVLHKAEGTAKLVRTSTNELILRFEEDFRSSNGPDLYVRLINDGDYTTYVELGRLKGNIGSQNYAVPADTNPSHFNTVIVWCKQFSVLFGTAKLASL